MTQPLFVHGSVVVLGEAGVLIEGPSGSGKSSLADALVAGAAPTGFASWIGDDRVGISPEGGRLIARPHAAVAGLVERRGLGLVLVPFEPACVLRLAVRLYPAGSLPPRLPDIRPVRSIAGIVLPLMPLCSADGSAANALRVCATLNTLQARYY